MAGDDDCSVCGRPTRGAAFCGHCGALRGEVGSSATSGVGEDAADRVAAAPAGSRGGDELAPDGADDAGGGRRRPLLGGLALLATVAVVLLVAGGIGGGGTPADDEVALPDDVEAQDAEGADDEQGAGEDEDTPAAGQPVEPGIDCRVSQECVRWRADVTAVQGDRGEDWVSVRPAGDGGLVVVGSRGLMGLGPEGRQRWMVERASTAPDPFAGVAVADDLLLQTEGAATVGRDPVTGGRRWRTEPPVPEGWGEAPVVRAAVPHEDVVLTSLTSGPSAGGPPRAVVRAHDREDGDLRWEVAEEEAAVSLGAGVAVVHTQREVRALDGVTGEQRWRLEIPWSSPEDVTRYPAVQVAFAHDALVLLAPLPMGGAPEDLRVHDVRTGEELARYEGRLQRGGRYGLVGTETPPLVTTSGGDAEAILLADDGAPAWREPLAHDSECCGRALAGEDVVMIASARSRSWVRVHDREDGRLLHVLDELSPASSPGTILNAETVLAPSGDGATAAHSLVDGEELWRAAPHGMPFGDGERFYLPVGDELVAVEIDPRQR